MKRRSIAAILLLAVLVTGCISVQIETKIKEDGSGTKSFVLALDRSAMSMLEAVAAESEASLDDFWEEVRTGADSIRGATVKEYRDEETEGIEIILPFDSLDGLQALSSSEVFENTDSVAAIQDGDITTLRATVDVGDVTSGLEETGDEGFEGFDLGEIEIEYTYTVEVEGEIVDYSPKDTAVKTDNGVTWDLMQSDADSVELMIKWKRNDAPERVVLLLVIIVLGGLVLAAVGVSLTAGGKRSSALVEASDTFDHEQNQKGR